MRRLYLQIYLAFLGILLLFGMLVTLASLLLPLHPQEHLLLMGWVRCSANSYQGQSAQCTSCKLQ